MISKRKINQIFRRFPDWTDEDISYLITDLEERKRWLMTNIRRMSKHRREEIQMLEERIVLVDDGLLCLHMKRYSDAHNHELLNGLFESYLKPDKQKEETTV